MSSLSHHIAISIIQASFLTVVHTHHINMFITSTVALSAYHSVHQFLHITNTSCIFITISVTRTRASSKPYHHQQVSSHIKHSRVCIIHSILYLLHKPHHSIIVFIIARVFIIIFISSYSSMHHCFILHSLYTIIILYLLGSLLLLSSMKKPSTLDQTWHQFILRSTIISLLISDCQNLHKN